jgi:hypothetical protein
MYTSNNNNNYRYGGVVILKIISLFHCFQFNHEIPVLQIHVSIQNFYISNQKQSSLGLNGGQCVPLGAGFVCNCPETFTGNRCEAPGT